MARKTAVPADMQPPRVVTGVQGRCGGCHDRLPLHPQTRLCGACSFGSAADLMFWDEPWIESEGLGRCERCGCDEDHACADGCEWDIAAARDGHWICSRCVPATTAVAEEAPHA